MNGHVLLLNQDYSALTICSVQRAVVLILLRKAELVEAHPDRYVRSPSTRLPWPSIVRLKFFVSVPYKKVMLSRQNVFRRDRFTCQYCGQGSDLTLDHVVPKSRGGGDTWKNLVTACNPCNNRKGNRTPEEAGMELLTEPGEPNYVHLVWAVRRVTPRPPGRRPGNSSSGSSASASSASRTASTTSCRST